jgi:hypothetical protein
MRQKAMHLIVKLRVRNTELLALLLVLEKLLA